MILANVMNRGATPALIKTLAFNESRLKMIAENVANIATPGYRAKQLDTKGFRSALRAALDAKGSDPNRPFVVQSGSEVATDALGFLKVTPSRTPVENLLFHDGTNLSIEQQMSDLAETGMTHEVVSTLLRGYFDRARKAIRGTV